MSTKLVLERTPLTGNGKKTCPRGFLRRGISSFRENWVFHIGRHLG
jgi:hypothetical protein